MKVKVGIEPASDVARVRAVRKAVGSQIKLGVDANGGILSVMSAHDLILRSGSNTERMRVTAAGNVGIGTATPRAKLEVGLFCCWKVSRGHGCSPGRLTAYELSGATRLSG